MLTYVLIVLIIGLSAFAGGRIANATVFARSAKIVGAMSEPSVHYVVRVRADVVATRWWSAVAAADDAPAVIRALLTGRSRVEVSADEALMIRAWAGAIDGWDEDGEQPLSFYPAAPAHC